MDEFELIQHYFDRPTKDPRISLSIGDDCALVDVPQGYELAFSIDTCLPGRHFFSDDTPANIASRAFRTALSDLAAMGATPLCFTLSLSLPESDDSWLKAFSERLHHEAEAFACPLVGGDTVRGALSISIQVQGTVPKGKAITRKGAQSSDIIYVSGSLGDAAFALKYLSGEHALKTDVDKTYFNERYYQPQPRIALAEKLVGIASAAIDISDGFAADLGHICHASGLGAELDIQKLPLSERICANLSKLEALQLALHGGDDYELCFTAPKSHALAVIRVAEECGVLVTPVGQLTARSGVRAVNADGSIAEHEIKPLGYKHFG